MSIYNDYYYITGLVRTLESKLLKKSQRTQMLDSHSALEAYLVLNDTDYAEAVNEFKDVNKYEAMIEKSLLETKRQLKSSCLDPQVLNIIWFYYDVYNAKTCLKAALQNKPFDDIISLLSSYGAIDKTQIRDFAFSNSYLPQFPLVKTKAENLYSQFKDIRYVDFVFDKILFEKMLEWSRELSSELIENLVKKWIDVNNVQISLRLDAPTKNEIGEYVFIPGGNIPIKSFSGHGEENKAIASRLFEGNEAMFDALEQENSFQLLEKQSSDLLTKFIKKARYISEGPEVVFGYWWARQKSSEVIRTILIGKLNDIDNEKTRKNVKKLY